MNRTATKILLGALAAVIMGLAAVFFPRPSTQQMLTLALQQIERGDIAGFDQTYTRLKSQAARSDESSFLAGVRLLRFGRVDAALARFASLKPEGFLRRPLMQYTGEALHQANRILEAERVFREILTEHPADIAAHRWMGIIYFDIGSFDLAIQHLNALIELDPADYRPYRMLGQIYQDFTQYTEAIRAYRSALERNPPGDTRLDLVEALAESLFVQNQYADALSILDQIQTSSRTESLRGRCFLNLGQTSDAEESLRLAKAAGVKDINAVRLEIDLLMARKDDVACIHALQEAIKLFPYDPSFHYQLALVLKNQNRDTEANLAMTEWQRLDQLTAKLSEKNRDVLINSHDPVLRDELAELCEQLGRERLAETWRKAASALRLQSPPN